MPRSGGLLVLRLTRAVGALALLVVGGIHLEQYKVAHFSVIPTIGPLFLVNFIAATLFGLTLLVPLGRNARPIRLAFDSLVALGGIGVSVGAFAALLISEHTPLFGFMEHGYRLEIMIALAAEAAAIVSLAAFLVCAARRTGRLRGAGGVTPTAITMPGAPDASGA
jgi:hypothetical protein